MSEWANEEFWGSPLVLGMIHTGCYHAIEAFLHGSTCRGSEANLMNEVTRQLSAIDQGRTAANGKPKRTKILDVPLRLIAAARGTEARQLEQAAALDQEADRKRG